MIVMGDLFGGGINIVADEGAARAVFGAVGAGAMDQVAAEKQGRSPRHNHRHRLQVARIRVIGCRHSRPGRVLSSLRAKKSSGDGNPARHRGSRFLRQRRRSPSRRRRRWLGPRRDKTTWCMPAFCTGWLEIVHRLDSQGRFAQQCLQNPGNLGMKQPVLRFFADPMRVHRAKLALGRIDLFRSGAVENL